MVSRLLALAALAVTLRVAHADPATHFPFRGFGSDQGLEGLAINRFAQTSDGLLWLATEDGLYAYDGARFMRRGISEGLPSDEITGLLADGDTLWVGTSKGLARVHDRVVTSIAGAGSARINGLAMTPNGTLWVASDAGVRVRVGAVVASAGVDGLATAIAARPDGSIAVAREHGVVVSSRSGWIALPIAAHDRIEDLAVLADGTLWARSALELWTCDPTLRECRDVSRELPDASEMGRLFVDHRGTLWATTRVGASHRLENGTWQTIGSADGLPARSVLAIFEDREGSLWFAGDELYQLLGRGLWREYTPHTGLPAETVWCVHRDRGGRLWLGTNRGVVYATADGWATIPGTDSGSIQAIVEDDTTLYAGGAAGQVYSIERTSLNVRRFDRSPDAQDIQTMVLHDGQLWAGTWDGGLWNTTPASARGTWSRVAVPGGDSHEGFGQLIEDRSHRIWAAGTSGLAVLDAGQWHRFTEQDGLAARSSFYVVERRSGELCVAYRESHGVSCFHERGGRLADIVHVGHETGLASDKVYLLGEDTHGRLYVGLGVGADLVSGSSIEHISMASGMVGDDCAARAFWADPDGSVFIGTTRGVARFESNRYEVPLPPPAPVLMDLRLGGGASSRSLSVTVATPTFANRARLVQELRVVPLDDTWRPVTIDAANYAKLSPGKYRIEARARFVPGAYGPTTVAQIVVPPAWWQTIWLRLALASLGLFAVALVYRWRSRLVAERTRVREVARSEASFRALIEQSPDAVFINREDRFLYANAQTSVLLGYDSAQALVGLVVSDHVYPDDRAVITERLRGLLETGVPTPVRETRMTRRDGTMVVVEASAIRLEIDGKPAIVTTARDCTERRAFEKRLMFADRMASVGTLAAGIAHEVNNPLAYLKANLAVLGEELVQPAASVETMKTALADALEGANRVQSIVQSVKAFSRAEAERRTGIDVQHALDLAMRMTANELKHRCHVVTDYHSTPAVLGSESHLGQVFMNLLVNAAQAMPTDGTGVITVRTATAIDGKAVVEIRDTGCGMTPEVQRRIFEPFFTTKDIGEGTGLGLSVCHGIIASMGGEIAVESCVGVGSTFRVTLPATERVATVSSRQSVAMIPVKRRVLVIDDDERLLASIGRMLRREHEVSLASSARVALDLLAAGTQVDVIVCDLMMPDFTGMAFHDHIARTRPDLLPRMLFMTGGAFTSDARQFLDQPAIRSIEKPFAPDDLRRRIQSIARGAFDQAAAA